MELAPTSGLSQQESGRWTINELEVSITEKCHLRCFDCGFLVPSQPEPTLQKSSIREIEGCLRLLEMLDIEIGSLAILGGEPTFNRTLLEDALVSFSCFGNIRSIEVVTHGLTPQGISRLSLSHIDKLTISVYYENRDLSELWKAYIQRYSPRTILSFRTEQLWDPWQLKAFVDDATAQTMFDSCWYRRHCTTIERGRLFVCSRIPKESRDLEGLPLSESTNLEEVISYLNQESFLPACKECTPMMGLPLVEGGRQPDHRVPLLVTKAIRYLQQQLIL